MEGRVTAISHMKRLFLVLVFVSLSSCRTTYHPYSESFLMSDDGYLEIPLDTDLYRVTFIGNYMDDAGKYAMFRAAELTLEKKYNCFVTLDSVVTDVRYRFSFVSVANQLFRMLHGPCSSLSPTVFNAKVLIDSMSSHIRRP